MIEIAAKSFKMDVLWKQVKTLRDVYNNKDALTLCLFEKEDKTLKLTDIQNNLNNLSQFWDIKHVSSEIQDVSDHILETGAKMFIYLNSCAFEQHYWKKLFLDELSDACISKFYLTLMKVLKTTRSSDAKDIVYKILIKFRSTFSFEHIYPEEFNSGSKKKYGLSKTFKKVKG